MQFSTMQQELSDRVSAFDNAVSSDLTKLKRWLNMAQQEISSKMNWPFMYAFEIIPTVTEYTTGTVSVTAAGTTATFSATITASKTNQFIKFSSAEDWYQITAHTGGASTATITPAYNQTSDLVSGTYAIRKLFYGFTASIDSILDIKRLVSPGQLESINARSFDMFLPLYHSTGTPYRYTQAPPDSSGNPQFSLDYAPSSLILLYARGIKRLTDMSADSDVSIVPARWHHVLLDLASFYAFSAVDDTRAKDFYQKAEVGIEDMARVHNHDLGRLRVFNSVDGAGQGGPVWSLPSNYGPEVWPL